MKSKQLQSGDAGWLKADDLFCFDCRPDLACFTSCCSDVDIPLSPYDTLRLKNSLGLTSSEFLDKYTESLATQNQPIPLVLLKMNKLEEKKCLLLGDDGCRAYSDRPLACRVFPLKVIDKNRFSIGADPNTCLGLAQPGKITIHDWLETQETSRHWAAFDRFTELVTVIGGLEEKNLGAKLDRMIFSATYDLDAFRAFMNESDGSAGAGYKLKPKNEILNDDEKLLEYGFNCLRLELGLT